MTSIFRTAFRRVTYTCHPCGARQRIPLRSVHFFERFHRLEHGEPVLIDCPNCAEGIQLPSEYRTHTGHRVHVSPDAIPENAIIHSPH